MFRSFDDPDKLRSLNLSMFVIVEASETSAETFQQLKTRLRNQAAFTETHDWRRGIVETNPGAGWIRSDFLLNAHSVQVHGNSFEQYPPSLTPDPNLSVHITTTSANKYLPPNFIAELSANRPAWWVQKYVLGSFQYAEGLVYPSASRCMVDPFVIPKHWKRIVACDYGLSDLFTFVAGAIDPKGVVYIYKIKGTNDRNIEELANMYFDFVDEIPYGGLYTPPLLDPKSGAKRDYNKKTLYDHFLDYGIYFKPGHIQVDARVFRVNTYLESGRLKIFNNCDELNQELLNYKFPERTLNAATANADKPVDKNNHYINAVEWICMELPANPGRLTMISGNANAFTAAETKGEGGWQLSDDNPNDKQDIFSMPQIY